MTTQKIVDLEDEQAIYNKFVDNFQGFASGKKQRNEEFRTLIRLRMKKHKNKQEEQNFDQMASLLEEKRLLDKMIQDADFIGGNKQKLYRENEKYLVTKRYRQTLFESQVDPFSQKEQILINLQIILSKLKKIHLENVMEGYLNILKNYGNSLLNLLQSIQSDLIEGKERRMVKKFYESLNMIMENISNMEQREELHALISFTN